jgi:hypothetical protein
MNIELSCTVQYPLSSVHLASVPTSHMLHTRHSSQGDGELSCRKLKTKSKKRHPPVTRRATRSVPAVTTMVHAHATHQPPAPPRTSTTSCHSRLAARRDNDLQTRPVALTQFLHERSGNSESCTRNYKTQHTRVAKATGHGRFATNGNASCMPCRDAESPILHDYGLCRTNRMNRRFPVA